MQKPRINNDEYGKLPPQAVEIEEQILAIIISDESYLGKALNIIRSECFYKTTSQIIFETMVKMSEQDKPIDQLTLVNELKSSDKLEEVGGVYYIAVLVSRSSGLITNFDYYCYVIFEAFVKREMIKLFQEETNNLFSDDADIFIIYNRVYDVLENIFESINDNQVKHMKSSIDNTIKEIEDVFSGKLISYVKTGISLYDKHVFLAPKFILGIAAPRGAGKTRYLIYLMKMIFENNNPDEVAALWYSFEDSDSKIIRLFAANKTGLTDNQMLNKEYKMTEDELNAVTAEIRRFSSYNIDFVNEQQSISQISRNITKFTKKHPTKICFLIIDNIMLLEDLYKANGNQLTVEDKVAASLRRIVNKAEKSGHKVIVIFLHHMTKEMEARANVEEAYRPKLSHMKGSTRFADICNAVVLINKPGLYKDLIKRHSILPDVKCKNSDGSVIYVKRDTLLRNMLITEVAKNRDGEMADDNIAVERYVAQLGTMNFNPLKCLKE